MPKHELTPRKRDVSGERHLHTEAARASVPLTSTGPAEMTQMNRASTTRPGWWLEDILLSGHAPEWMTLARAVAVESAAHGPDQDEEVR